MKKYIEILKNNFQISLMYKWNVLITSLMDVFRLIAEIAFWHILFNTGSNSIMYGYQLNELITYYFFMYIVGAITAMGNIGYKVAEDIKTGNINNLILKPISCKLYYFCEILGQKIVQLMVSLIIFIPVAILMHRFIIIEISLKKTIFFIISLIWATVLTYLINLVISFLVFWFTEVTSFFFVKDILVDFLSGKTFPIDILPTRIISMFNFLPFVYCTYFPIKVLIANMEVDKILCGLLIQCTWIIVVIFIAKLLWTFGLKRYSGTGM